MPFTFLVRGRDDLGNDQLRYALTVPTVHAAIGNNSNRVASAVSAPKDSTPRKTVCKEVARAAPPPRFDPKAYPGRNVVERAINRLKDFRAVAMHHEKRGHNFFGTVILATIMS